MYGNVPEYLQREITGIREAGLYKEERVIVSPQSSGITVVYPPGQPPREVINFCANNYLGLSSHPEVIAAARRGLDERGYGMSSVRFICGTQDIHKQLERKISEFLGTDDTILYSSCFDANGGLFETLMKEEDAVITDSLNHASIIDGIRLSKAKRLIYKHNDMADLETKLREAADARFRMIATDGAFSMGFQKGTFYFLCSFGGRPRGRRLDSRPRRVAVRPVQTSDPYGAPRFTLRRSRSNSVSVIGSFTHPTQSRPRGTGPASKNISRFLFDHQRRLDQRHSSARSTNSARSGLRST